MNDRKLVPVSLTAEGFAPFGEVIECTGSAAVTMNDAHFDRFVDLAHIDCDVAHGGRAAVGIVRCRVPARFPCPVARVERHPLGSQAFIPFGRFPFVVVVAPPGASVRPEDLRAFVSDGAQGINYRRGTWHMPLIGLEEGQEFLVIDRVPAADNCEERIFDDPPLLAGPG